MYFVLRLKIIELLDKKVVSLFGGERKRVEILRDILYDKDIYLLDELISLIDEESSLFIWEILKEIVNDKLVIVLFYEVNFIKFYVNGIMDLDNKEVVI